MKPRLPHCLTQALLTTCATALTATSQTFADVPEGYTTVIIDSSGALSPYSGKKGKYAFLFETDLNKSTNIAGESQYWSSIDDINPYSIIFTSASSSIGGAIRDSNLVMENFNQLEFSQCRSSSYETTEGGGAISATVDIERITTLKFDGNQACYRGGAICGEGDITLDHNGEVSFGENFVYASNLPNSSVYGGAIYAHETYNGAGRTISISNNEKVSFAGNYASSTNSYYAAFAYGGAIYGGSKSILDISENSVIIFQGNHAGTSSGASSTITALGGAIYGNQSNIILRNNGELSFLNNYATRGGAIYAANGTAVRIIGNESVTFRGNYEKSVKTTPSFRLRSIYSEGKELTLCASAGHNITFYDTICIQVPAGTPIVSYNVDYADGSGNSANSTGKIVFSGAYAVNDLKALKSNYTKQELTESLTSEVYATTNLCGGTLSIEDGAIYKGWGINVAEDSYATLCLSNGSLEHAEYDITLATSATLEASGVDRITAAMLAMNDGSSMKLAAGATLDVDGTIAFTASRETTWSVEGGAEITADKMAGSGSTISSLNNVNVNIIENYTIENMSISGSVIDISEGTTLYVKHVNIEADARITDEAAWLNMVDTHGWLDNSNTEAAAPVMSLGDTLFYRSGDDAWIRLNQGVSYVALTSELFSNVTLTGSDLWLDLTGLADTIGNAQAFSIAFKDALYDANGLRVVATVDGEHYLDGYYTTKQEGTTTTLYFSSQIPEPATGTLSLLALALTATRRKRK